jgi:hypothetical protein
VTPHHWPVTSYRYASKKDISAKIFILPREYESEIHRKIILKIPLKQQPGKLA